MDRSQSVQLSTECSTDPKSSQPQNRDLRNEIPTNVEELDDPQRVYSQTPKEPIDVSQTDNTPEISGLSIHIGNPQIQQDDSLIDTNFESGSTHVEQESSSTIELLIHAPEVTTVSKNSSVKSKTGKRSKEKLRSMQHPITFENKPEVPNELKIPHSSTEFNYRGELIPIHIKQCNVHKISHGEFGDVFSIVLKGSTDLPIAVKCIPREKIKVSEVAIMQEVCKSENLYIVDYHCALLNPVNLSLYICMEFMDASIDAFYKLMHAQDKLECDKLGQLVRRIVHDIASGLSFMEIKGIIHRDIKPANLLINKNAFVKLCDFGISRSFTQLNLYFNDLNDTDYSLLSPLLHTENYMPFRIKGVIQDDMWSLGITLLEVVSGSNPFANWPSGGRYNALMCWKPCIPPIISDDMQQLILHLLEKEAEDRPRSYNDILNKPSISNLLDAPSRDECDFVCSIIERIPRPGSSDK